ncbi:MAG: glycosyltransferase [Candidatus Omnitrophota bacterium]|jgi:glycosyltransferase involved in cell wall biosynthesis
MKILWVSMTVPYPLNKGGNIRTCNLLKNMNKEHSITYLSYLDDAYLAEKELVELMKNCSSKFIFIKKKMEKKFTGFFFLRLFLNFFSSRPYIISKYCDVVMRKLVSSTIDIGDFDIIVCDYLSSTALIPERYWNRTVLFEHNIESMIWQRHYKVRNNLFEKAYLFLQWLKVLKYEKNCCLKFKAFIAVSEGDKKKLLDFGAKYASVISTGVDTTAYSPIGGGEKSYNLVFTGSMDWLPNEDAMVYFVKSIYPKVKSVVPQVNLTVVGRLPTAEVKELKNIDSSVEITGSVDDVLPYIDRAQIYIVPLRVGGGTRLKVFEAMSMEKAIVSTTIGAEGLQYENNKNIVIADTDELFAEEIIRLFKDPVRRKTIGVAARQHVVENYEWKAVTKNFEKILIEYCG